MSTYFKTTSIGNLARTGILTTRAGLVTTPTFMPDGTRGAVKGLLPEQVAACGIEVMLSNTFHLHLAPGDKVIKSLGGVRSFSGWKGPILTDSGGFQVFSLSKMRTISEEGVTFRDPRNGDKVFLSPEISMQIQINLGSDIIIAFDDLTGLSEEDRGREEEAFYRTQRWLDRSIAEFQRLTKDMADNERPLLFGVVQGGLSEKLRAESLAYVQERAVDGIAIGGLSVGETRDEMQRILRFLEPLYDPTRVRFLLGVGDPRDIRYGIEHGIDMFDCVLPTRNARHGSVWVEDDSQIHLTNARFAQDSSPIDPDCDCYTCAQGFSKGFLRHQFKSGEPLAGSLASIHNLRYLQRICEGYRKQL
jgi:queuine tRNA-ribosyltransferase